MKRRNSPRALSRLLNRRTANRNHGSRRRLLSGATPRLVCCAALIRGLSVAAATLPADWQFEQSFSTPAGVVKLNLPVETLDVARAGLEDVRLFDDNGNEVPYLIERPMPAGNVIQNAKSFQVSLTASTSVITIESGVAQPIDGIVLESPAADFIKPVMIEGSSDGNRWQTLAQGQPVFRQPNGVSRLDLAVPAGAWRSLRLTVDDQRSARIPFTGARVRVAASESAPNEPLPVAIAERHENPGETRLTLNLGAANLTLAAVHIETTDPLFTRQITLAVPQVLEDSIREQTLAQGVIYQVVIEAQRAASNLSVRCEAPVRSRELLMLIKNQDSPPLSVTAVRAERRPVYLVFFARQAGLYHLLAGNSRCSLPSYDLASLSANLKSVPVSTLSLPAPTGNPNYRAPEVLPGIEQQGAALDVSGWSFRKAVKPARSGAQQIELDLDVLSHAQPGFEDLRLLRDGRQLPYILERTSISRPLTPAITVTNDAKDSKLGRWIIKLPRSNLPVTRLNCAARTALFQRDLTLYEVAADDRGENYRRTLGGARWVQTPEHRSREFFLMLEAPPRSDTLVLETQNGDNPPIELDKFQLFYPATRVLFKAKAEDELFLYYGNLRAETPRYDLSLVAGQLLAADKAAASPAAEEQLKWAARQTPGEDSVVFWGILALVVVVLLFVIARLLPKSPPQ